MWARMCATCEENPHCGKSLVPFMNKTTSLLATALRIQSWTACSLMPKVLCCGSSGRRSHPHAALDVGNGRVMSIWRRRRGQRQGVQDPPHAALQRLVDHLVLLHPGLAPEFLADDMGGVMVAIASKVSDDHLGIGKAGLDQARDLLGIHGHQASLQGRGCGLAYDRPGAGWNTTGIWKGKPPASSLP